MDLVYLYILLICYCSTYFDLFLSFFLLYGLREQLNTVLLCFDQNGLNSRVSCFGVFLRRQGRLIVVGAFPLGEVFKKFQLIQTQFSPFTFLNIFRF